MWNNTSFPAYKSRLWDMSGKDQNHNHGHGHGAEHLGAEKRKPYVLPFPPVYFFFLESDCLVIRRYSK